MTSKKQAAYLRRMYARRWAAKQRQCDCPGTCDTTTCEGFTPGCICDESHSIREALGLQEKDSDTATKDPPAATYGDDPNIPF